MGMFMGVPWDDRTARIAFAVVFEPSDRIAGAAARRGGVEAAFELAADDDPIERLTYEQAMSWHTFTRARMSEDLVSNALTSTRALGLDLIVPGDAAWPGELEQLGDRMPQALWAQGNTGLLGQSAQARLAVVGTRTPTGYGQDVTGDFVTELAEHGVQIVSGGQYGVDATAHRAALLAGAPRSPFCPPACSRCIRPGTTGSCVASPQAAGCC